MSDIFTMPLASPGSDPAGDQALVLRDAENGRTIRWSQQAGRQSITHSAQSGGQDVTLTDAEVEDILAWKNSGRRNSFWNWPGWARYGIVVKSTDA